MPPTIIFKWLQLKLAPNNSIVSGGLGPLNLIFVNQFKNVPHNNIQMARVRGMLIKQIIELRGPGPLAICIPITGCFHDKTTISKENIRLDCYLLLKYCRKQCTLLPPTWAKSLTKFNLKMQDFKRVLDLNCK